MFLVWTLLFISAIPTTLAETTETTSDPEMIKKQLGEQYRASQPQSLSYEGYPILNDFVSFAVNSSGHYTIATTGGDPDNRTDDNQNMLYGHPYPWSSYTTVNVDGVPHIYEANKIAPIPNESDLSNTSEQLINQHISVQQVLKIIPSTSTKRDDTVEIKYIVKNNDTNPHDIGLRIMMDTMLGLNDHAPFQIPGIGPVTTEMEFTGAQIPEYWQAFDSLSEPKVIAQGHLTNTVNKPDKVQFTNWSYAYDHPWNYQIRPGANNNDSAVSVYWNLKALAAGETREYVTHYGLSDLVQDMRPPVTLSITGPQKIQKDSNGNYTPNPATVTAYIQNIGDAPAENVQLELLHALKMKLVDGQNKIIQVGTLGVGETKQVSWQVEFLPLEDAATLSYGVRMTSSNADTKTLNMNVEVPAHQAKEKRAVIFLPGMVGSGLGWNSEMYWTPDIGEIDEDLRRLLLDANGNSIDTVAARRPIDDFYKKIQDALLQHDANDDSIADLDVYIFPYDWRLDNDIHARNIEEFINDMNIDKVSIVAHSMGGVVASKFIANGNSDRVDKLITIGTPHLGAPKSLYVFETGNLIGGINDWFVSNGLKRLAPNMSSAYQLLPNTEYFSYAAPYYIQKITDRGLFRSPKVEKLTSYDASKQFLRDRSWGNHYLIDKMAQFHQDISTSSTLNSVDSYIIVGYNSGTQGIIKQKFHKDGSFDSSDFEPINGDGTVPLASGTLGGRIEKEERFLGYDYYYYSSQDNTYFVEGVDHSALQSNDKVIKQVLQILDGNPTHVSGIESRAKLSPWIKIRVESPVDLHVYDQDGNHVGPVNEDRYDENIPSGTYTESGHTKTTVLKYGNYDVKLDGTGHGTATLILQKYNELNELEKTVRFDNVEVNPDTIITTHTDMENAIQLVIDQNGDGNTITMEPSAVLDAEGSQDETPAEISFDIEGVKSDYNWYNSDVKVSINAVDAESGVKKIEYRLNEGETKLYEEPLSFTEEGTTKLEATALNNNRIYSDGISTDIKIDQTVPEFNLYFDPYSETFKLKAIDALSGLVTEEITITPVLRTEQDLESLLDIPESQQTILIKDKANNTLELTLAALGNGSNAVLKLISLKYNDIAVNLASTKLQVNYSKLNGEIQHLHQNYTIEGEKKVTANYSKSQDLTSIVTIINGTGAYREKKAEMVLLNVESHKGSFTIKE